MFFIYFIIAVIYLQKILNEVYKHDSDITNVSDSVSHIPQPISSDQGQEETQKRSSPEDVTLSIGEHIGSNTI